MSDREIPLREAREQLGPLVEDANHGQVTIITKYGKPYAALVPLDRIVYDYDDVGSELDGLTVDQLAERGRRARPSRTGDSE